MTLSDFFKEYKIDPKNSSLYYQALTHASFVNEKRSGKSYQRLEFVGDALIDMATAEYMFKKYPELSEGEMTVIRSNVVNAEALALHSKEMGLDKLMRIGKGADEVRTNTKVLSDLFESVSATIYLDQGIKAFIDFLSTNIFKKIDKVQGQELKNPKTVLQEHLQADSRGNIEYITNEKNDNGRHIFFSSVKHDGIVLGKGKGKNTKIAEVEAAKDALKKGGGK